ncbi:hypothetical protein AB4144_07795 [Rhizobiaceae sp. 2RAB30]
MDETAALKLASRDLGRDGENYAAAGFKSVQYMVEVRKDDEKRQQKQGTAISRGRR